MSATSSLSRRERLKITVRKPIETDMDGRWFSRLGRTEHVPHVIEKLNARLAMRPTPEELSKTIPRAARHAVVDIRRNAASLIGSPNSAATRRLDH